MGWGADLALTGVRNGERRAGRILASALAVAFLIEAATTALVFSRGRPLPGVAGGDRFGWQPLAVGLLAWTAGLVLARPAPIHEARPAPPTLNRS